jgi:hypothetical protein
MPKIPKCIGMLGGSEHTIKTFSLSLAKEGVEMSTKEYLAVEDIIDALTDDIDAVFITDAACNGVPGGREEVIKKLRAADKTIRIIFLCKSEKRDEEFENFCPYQRISDIFYPVSNGSGELTIPIKPMAKCVKKGRLEPNEGETNIVETSHLSSHTKDGGFFGNVSALIDRAGDVIGNAKPRIQIIEKEVIRYVERDSSVSGASSDCEIYVPEPTGTVIIGVFNICRGAGATTMAVELAKESSKRGTRVYVIAADGSDDLEYSKVHHRNIRMSTNVDVDAALLDAMCCGTQLIIFDFGLLLESDRHGNIVTDLTKVKKKADRLSTCKLKIAMCLSAPWHLTKLMPYTCGQNPKIVPTHIVLDERVGGINFPDVYERDQLPYAAIINGIGVSKKRKGK